MTTSDRLDVGARADSDALNALILGAIPFAKMLAQPYASPQFPRDEAVAEALFALVVAAGRFDPTRGVPWLAFVKFCVHRRLNTMAAWWWRRPVAAGDAGGPPRSARMDPSALDPADAAAVNELVGQVGRRVLRHEFDVLWKVHAVGRDRTDVARELGVSRQCVGQVERRAMKRLAALTACE